MDVANSVETVCTKDRTVAAIREFGSRYMGEKFPDIDLSLACLWWSSLTVKHLHRMGLPAIVQAGSFQCLYDTSSDSKTYSYLWEISTDTIDSIAKGEMPEMHVWVLLPTNPPEIVDLTTRYIQSNFARDCREPWLTPQPPDYVWHPFNSLPDNFVYAPSPDATLLALGMIRNIRRWTNGDM